MSPDRHQSLDALRGFAVMGILLMNIIGFSMPMAAYVNPAAWGGSDGADFWAWAIAFTFIDGKMRGLFSLLFGASMLLVVERAEAKGEDPTRVHMRRMFWLFLFGLIHFCLIWAGDILALYALCGAFALSLRSLSVRGLIWMGLAFMLLNMLFWSVTLLSVHDARFAAITIGASAEARADFAAILAELGASGGDGVRQDIALHLGSYAEIVESRLADVLGGLVGQLFAYGPETVGLMAWGMALLKSGALTGAWEQARYLKAAAIAYALGLPISLMLVWAATTSGFDPLVMADIFYAGSLPPRMAMMLGHTMLLLWLISRMKGILLDRIAAAGRAAFSNYIATSIVMTTIFYGYGLGLYGGLPRAAVYLVVPLMWLIMLLWSKPWLDRFQYGPLEWLWRSLARGQRQPFSKG